MVETEVERSHKAEQQRTRRLAKRTCGQCGQPAEAMLTWGSQKISICGSCQKKLDGPEMITPWCAFNEVHPLEVQPQVPAVGVLIEARLMPPVDLPARRRSLAGRFLGALGQIFRFGAGRKTRRAIIGDSD